MPFSLPFPENYQEKVQVELPSVWHVTESEMHFKNAGFAFNSKFYCISNNVYLDVDYENYKDNVTADEAPAYFKDIADYEDANNFELSQESNKINTENTGNDKSPLIILLVVLIIGGILWGRMQNKF
jgi:hypothetical protein